jgi:hypothetical protein
MINTSEADGHAHDPARAYEEGWNDALTSIITWYKEELKVLENVEQYKCKSYFDENNTLQDCTCKKCS